MLLHEGGGTKGGGGGEGGLVLLHEGGGDEGRGDEGLNVHKRFAVYIIRRPNLRFNSLSLIFCSTTLVLSHSLASPYLPRFFLAS